MRVLNSIKFPVSILALALLASGCGGRSGGSKVLAPQFQPQVVNTPNVTFSLQATGLQGVSDALAYNWNASSGTIVIHPATTTNSGTITLNIRDAGGTVIYNGTVPASGDIMPPSGTPGVWAIGLTLSQYTGTINFAVQMQ